MKLGLCVWSVLSAEMLELLGQECGTTGRASHTSMRRDMAGAVWSLYQARSKQVHAGSERFGTQGTGALAEGRR